MGLKPSIRSWINNQNLNKKLILLYTLGIFLPLVIIDWLFMAKVFRAEEIRKQNKMEAELESVEYNLTQMFDSAILLSKNIGLNIPLRGFLATRYESPLDYWKAYQGFIKGSFLDSLAAVDTNSLQIYADNETIINGGYFQTLSSVKDKEWMKTFRESGKPSMLMFYYERDKSYVMVRRKAVLLSRLKSAPGVNQEQIVRINVDYTGLARTIVAQKYDFQISIWDEDRLIISNYKNNDQNQDFERWEEGYRPSFQKEIQIYGKPLRVTLRDEGNLLLQVLKGNALLFFSLLLLSFLLPSLLIVVIGKSIRVRILMLSEVFKGVESDHLTELSETDGEDEIGTMMKAYNRMARRMNSLIETVYKNRLKEQEIDIARQKAELLALRSQINPHFLFNALESIRMHSLLRQEYDTAKMVEKLAMMQRQNVDWSFDVVKIRQEASFLEAYLDLQTLRFGNRIHYQLELEGCEDYLIPKLTLVTFVENACIHSLEKTNAPGWIFVRAWTTQELLHLEVEDTGCGMSQEEVLQMSQNMNHANIHLLQTQKHVGVINASLRLKMVTEGQVTFEVESEKDIGTIVHIAMKKLVEEKEES